MVISLLTTSQSPKNLPIGFIAVSLGLNWALMLYFGAKLGRHKLMLYPIMFVINPFFNWIYMVYGIFTAGQRTWGGPRADAGKADAKTTPEQAIEGAAARGDELNVVPETFRPALEGARRRVPHHTPLLPSPSLDGRFAGADVGPGGWYLQTHDSGVLRRDSSPRHAEEGRASETRQSSDLAGSRGSSVDSTYTPRRVESIVGIEDSRDYFSQQARQRPAGGAHFEHMHVRPSVITAAASNNLSPYRRRSVDSVVSVASDETVPLHFDIPLRGRTMDRLTPSTLPTQPQRPLMTHPAPLSSHPPSPTLAQNNYTVGPSPLARKSFTRLAADETSLKRGGSIASKRAPRRHSVAVGESRGRRSVSVDRYGRRRLSKQRRAESEG